MNFFIKDDSDSSADICTCDPCPFFCSFVIHVQEYYGLPAYLRTQAFICFFNNTTGEFWLLLQVIESEDIFLQSINISNLFRFITLEELSIPCIEFFLYFRQIYNFFHSINVFFRNTDVCSKITQESRERTIFEEALIYNSTVGYICLCFTKQFTD